MLDILKNKYVRFAIAAIIYILWVIWIGSYWLLIGLGIVFDVYVSKKVNWSFWKKREGKNNSFIEWLDALIFAVIAVSLINIFLFQNYKIPTGSMEKSLLIGDHLAVSKVAFGPRLPNTPIAFPFTQHTIPLIKTKSWSNLIKAPYRRLKGFSEVKNDDIVVFNFPAGDTVVLENQITAYDEIIRSEAYRLKNFDMYSESVLLSDKEYSGLAREEVWKSNNIIYRPVDRRENYVKRCVAIAGDTIKIKGGVLHINGVARENNGREQTNYQVWTNGARINPKAFERMKIAKSDINLISGNMYLMPLTEENARKIDGFTNVKEIKKNLRREGEYGSHIFPHNPYYPWNEDYFGPLWIPEKGKTIALDTNNICFYERIIDVYEENDFEIKDNKFFLNGEEISTYTFKMNYYWMMGDNRHDSADSRFWGFVPEDHIVGKPKFVWLSIDKDFSGFKKIRLNRMFRKIK